MKKTVKSMVDDAMDDITSYSVDDARGMFKFGVDPQSPYRKPVFGEDKRFVLFCAAGWRSALATKPLQEMGIDKVAPIDGGFTAWKEAGAPAADMAVKPRKA